MIEIVVGINGIVCRFPTDILTCARSTANSDSLHKLLQLFVHQPW